MLEEELAEAMGHTWEELFGRLAQPMHDLLANQSENVDP
jgi:hypothetical protein